MIVKPNKSGVIGLRQPVLVDRWGNPINRRGAANTTLSYTENATSYAVATTLQASAGVVVQGPVLVFNGSTRVRLEFRCGGKNDVNTNWKVDFWLDTPATDLGVSAKGSTALSFHATPIFCVCYYTPPAGASSFSVRAWGTVSASNLFMSTSNGYPANYLRVSAA